MNAGNPRAALAVVITEGFLGRLAFGMLSFAFPLFARSLGLSVAEIGLLISLRSIVVLPLKPAAGWLTDRIGIRQVYLLALLVRVVSAAWMLLAGDFLSLAGIRLLQGVSAAGRDVGSLGVVVRDAEDQVGAAYGWYATAKHIGGVAGAAVAGLLVASAGGSYGPLWLVILALSVLPLAAAYWGLREEPEVARETAATAKLPLVGTTKLPAVDTAKLRAQLVAFAALLRELAGPASVGMLVAASAYMLHGIFPVLATEYAGLSAAQAGWIYTASAVVFVVCGPAFGWLNDRYGRGAGLAARSAANIGSSLLYLAAPGFGGMLAARAIDDAGKAAFKPAWAAVVAAAANADRKQRGRRIGALDTAETAGEVVGPLLAGVLWQSGGIVALFAGRVLLAIAAELAAVLVFGELRHRLRPSATATAMSFLAPPVVALLGAWAWLGVVTSWNVEPVPMLDGLIGLSIVLLGVLTGAWAGCAAARAERRADDAVREARLADFRHDVRRSLTVIRGEVELILSRGDIADDERHISSRSVVHEVEQLDAMMRFDADPGAPSREDVPQARVSATQ